MEFSGSRSIRSICLFNVSIDPSLNIAAVRSKDSKFGRSISIGRLSGSGFGNVGRSGPSLNSSFGDGIVVFKPSSIFFFEASVQLVN